MKFIVRKNGVERELSEPFAIKGSREDLLRMAEILAKKLGYILNRNNYSLENFSYGEIEFDRPSQQAFTKKWEDCA